MKRKNHYLKPNWPAPQNVCAYCTTKPYGHSSGSYAQFNLASHTADNPKDVVANRKQLVQELQLPSEPIWLCQTHSNIALCIDHKQEYPKCDAVYTTKPDTICAVLTADCLPILICDQQGTTVAAIHAGWRGLSNNIIANTVNKLMVPGKQLLAWLGPAISQQAFEVSKNVYDAFTQLDPNSKIAFKKINMEKWLADLYTLARIFLTNCGIKNIYGGQFCTYTEKERFFSYRRQQSKTGRMASIIWFSKN